MIAELIILLHSVISFYLPFLPSQSKHLKESIEFRGAKNRTIILSPINLSLVFLQLITSFLSIREGFQNFFQSFYCCLLLNKWQNYINQRLVIGENLSDDLLLLKYQKTWRICYYLGITGMMQIIFGHYYFVNSLHNMGAISDTILAYAQLFMVMGLCNVLYVMFILINDDLKMIQKRKDAFKLLTKLIKGNIYKDNQISASTSTQLLSSTVVKTETLRNTNKSIINILTLLNNDFELFESVCLLQGQILESVTDTNDIVATTSSTDDFSVENAKRQSDRFFKITEELSKLPGLTSLNKELGEDMLEYAEIVCNADILRIRWRIFFNYMVLLVDFVQLIGYSIYPIVLLGPNATLLWSHYFTWCRWGSWWSDHNSIVAWGNIVGDGSWVLESLLLSLDALNRLISDLITSVTSSGKKDSQSSGNEVNSSPVQRLKVKGK